MGYGSKIFPKVVDILGNPLTEYIVIVEILRIILNMMQFQKSCENVIHPNSIIALEYLVSIGCNQSLMKCMKRTNIEDRHRHWMKTILFNLSIIQGNYISYRW